MRDTKVIPDLKVLKSNGQFQLNLKRIRTGPRQKIRQLLRSFVPMKQLEKAPENG
jgi:hypothetical protein